MRILIVDDESLNRFLLKHMLEAEGYTDCIEAENGVQALELAKLTHPDIILLDVLMPEMDGFEAAPRLKELEPDNYLPIIFITALDDNASLVKCLEVGGDDFVSKPFDKTILAAKIRAHGRIRELSTNIDKQNQELRYFRQNVHREHAIVEHIFSNAIVNNPEVTRYFDYKVAPAADFNGDVFLCEASPRKGMYFLVGDFTGHGLASAIGALPVTRAFQAMASKGLSVGEMARTINQTLLQLLPADMFFAAVIAEFDCQIGRITIWNGSMPQVLLKTADGQGVRRFPSRHMALGVLEDDEFEDDCDVMDVQCGDQLLACTDGLIELMNKSGVMLEEAGVEDWFCSAQDVTVDTLYKKAMAYMHEPEQSDDITIVRYTCTDVVDISSMMKVCPIPVTLSTRLEAKELKQGDGLEILLTLINGIQGVNWVRSNLFTVLTELMNNALEHGLLKLDSALKSDPEGFLVYYEERERRLSAMNQGHIDITFTFSHVNRTLTVSVHDSGDGFDTTKLLGRDDENSFGRGILLLEDICETVSFADGGRNAIVTMKV